MSFKQQFEILNKIIAHRLSEEGIKPTLKNAAAYLGIPVHKYQAWKDGQRPVTEDMRMLAQEFEFQPDWLLLGVGEPVQPRMNKPFDPKFVEICDTLHELVRGLPDKLPKVAEVGGMTTTDLYDCIHTQAFPPADAIAKWIIHYRINANFLLAQIGKPYLTEEQYNENGPLDFVRQRRGDHWTLDDDTDCPKVSQDDTNIASGALLQKLLTAHELNAKLAESNAKLSDELTRLNEERRRLTEQLKLEHSQQEHVPISLNVYGGQPKNI